MKGRTPSLYLRKIFTVSAENAPKEEPFRLSAAADSGFVAFVNGHEIARANLGRINGFVYADQSAFSSVDRNENIRYDSGILASEALREGENVFAVQVQNTVPRQINERDDMVDTTLGFAASLKIGLGIFAGGSNVSIDLPADGWKYRIGYTEPSGGVVDWVHAEHPEVEASFSDWIELHNNGGEEVDLSGWHLTDDPDEPTSWEFPKGTRIPADGYLVILADGNTEVPGEYLHASFSLAGDGEFLGLADASGQFVSRFEDGFPKQSPFHSYGLNAAGDGYAFFSEPSPGAANGGPEASGFVERPVFDPVGGFYQDTVELIITSDTEGAVIRYTLDGTEPTEFHGMVYQAPITIELINAKTGTAVRARAFKENMISSADVAQTYLVGVEEAFQSIPSVSLVADEGYAFYAPHGVMTVQGGSVGDDWRANGVEDYYMPDMHGRAFERKVSMELIYPEEGTNVQIDGGIRLAASAWSRGRFTLRQTDRSPWPSTAQEKPSFNIFFRRDYGQDALDFPFVENYPGRRFHQLRLRAGKNDIRNPWITDELCRRVMADTGQLGSVGIQNALFVNGVYKGYFNTVSRLREELFQELYGSNNPWQVKHVDVWADGTPFPDTPLRDTPEWDHLESLLTKDLEVLENYRAVLQELDPVNFADYFIVNIYGATWDWPHNNVVIARELSDQGRWRAYVWDAEGTFGVAGGHGLTYNSISSDLNNGIGRSPSDDLATVWKALLTSPEWRLLFADRLQNHFFTPGGALTEENMTRHLEDLKTEIADLMRFGGGGNIRTDGIENWIERREAVLFKARGQLESEKLWGDVQVPSFSPSGGGIDAGTPMKISLGSLFNPQMGDIFYTTNGSDPRLPEGRPDPDALLYDRQANTGLVIDTTMTVKARARVTALFDPIGKWSALQEATFRVGRELATGQNLLISELMIDPARATEAAAGFATSDFEYIEFYNPSEVTVDLADLRFTAGIDYIFREGEVTILGPKAYGVVVSDRAAFARRYGGGLPILGQFDRKLKNAGEHLEISDGSYEPIVSLTYSNDPPWPEIPDDQGNSLVFSHLDAELDTNDPTHWEASSAAGGTPGWAQGAPPDPEPPSPGAYAAWRAAHFSGPDFADDSVSGFTADPDDDGAANLAEFAWGSKPTDAGAVVTIEAAVQTHEVEGRPGDYLTLTLKRRTDAPNLRYALERSPDLDTWQTVDSADLVEIDSQAIGEGLETVTLRTAAIGENVFRYLRWRAELYDPPAE